MLQMVIRGVMISLTQKVGIFIQIQKNYHGGEENEDHEIRFIEAQRIRSNAARGECKGGCWSDLSLSCVEPCWLGRELLPS
jgi:hypothetical protein